MSTLSRDFTLELLRRYGLAETDADLTRLIVNREIGAPILDGQMKERFHACEVSNYRARVLADRAKARKGFTS